MEKSIHSARYAVFLRTLKAAREKAGLTQVQLAKRLGRNSDVCIQVRTRGAADRRDGIADVLSGVRAQPEAVRGISGEGDREGEISPGVLASHSWQLITFSLCW